MGRVDDKLQELGLSLPATRPRDPQSPLISAVRVGGLVWLSGSGPAPGPGGKTYKGKLGRDVSIEEGYEAARQCGLALLAALKAEIGDLDKVTRVVKLLSMVNCTEDFADTPRVAHGCSDLFVQLWGEAGKHTRSAVGMASLPGGIPVEIEAIFQVAEG
jgi:enamine deaminase RidA (YjgF/YER057c/UK114 family)